jgi:hypothetical protein
MSETPTPGQVAYEAHARAWDRDMLCTPAWACLPARHKDAWEAAAQAVLAHCTPQEDTP